MQSPYVICFANGCMSDYEVTPELLANMKKGRTWWFRHQLQRCAADAAAAAGGVCQGL